LINEQTGPKFAQVDDLVKAVQELSGKMVEREREGEKLRETLASFQTDIGASNEKTQAQLNEDVTTLKARLDKLDDDPDGIGGFKQVHEKCTIFEKTFGEFTPKFEDSLRLVKENTSRTEEFDRKLRDLSRQCEDLTEQVKAAEAKVKDMDGITSTVHIAQEALEDAVTRKYEKLWEDVLHSIDEVKSSQLEAMRTDMDSQTNAAKLETRSLVNYALNFMASAHGERRQNAINKSLIMAWKEQTRISDRRRMGISYLQKIMQRRHRVVFDTWHRKHSTSVLCDRLHGQYTGQLSDVYKALEDGDAKLKGQCDKLQGEVTKLDKEKASNKHLEETAQQLRQTLQEELKAIHAINAKLKDHGEGLRRHDELHRNHGDAEATLDAKISGLGRELSDLIVQCQGYARNEEVKGMIRDILLIWNSIKQLDTAKADKKDVDSFALETGNRDKLSSRRFDDLEADFASKSRQETLRIQEKWSELDGRLDESGRQFRHWEQMWEKLSGFVEDLVAKIGDLQGDKLPSTMKGRNGSRDNLARSRDIPTLPHHHPGHGGHDHAAASRPGMHQHAEGLDTKMLWINSAKGIVDATIDQACATTPTAARPKSASRTRPTSATATRRPHDRAR